MRQVYYDLVSETTGKAFQMEELQVLTPLVLPAWGARTLAFAVLGYIQAREARCLVGRYIAPS
jgi:hypothetical protein